ncbi:hypothetical protein [Burkholderia sp. Bp9142]|uniref:hypothetical protein n=1 Tax=Burkholderia sp. Bp9142 TaxID=2184573 RepID=UPI000F5A96AE|nr:hypothetical protein [Burkholderia sp. Bp9142]RQR27303.1 hypothetical protein DIE22_30990 [Burkholderia sp. Bp9142]
MSYPTIPEDFPRESPQGAIGGYRPKLLLRRAGGQLISRPTDEELFTRYDACEDLARQLATYTRRKLTKDPLQSLSDSLSHVETDMTKKVSSGQWDISSAEIAWIMKRVRDLLAMHVLDDRDDPNPEIPGAASNQMRQP